MELAGKGLPAGGPAGYEILDGLTGFGTTSQMFDAAYWRAKEGELARTITGSPERPRRTRPPRQPGQPAVLAQPAGSASVTVTMARGELDRGQAEAIRYLVSSAVAGITPDAVAVIDAARGVVLAGEEDPLKGGGGATDREATLRPTSSGCSRPASARAAPSSRSTSTRRWTARRSPSAPSTPTAGSRSPPRSRRSSETASGTNPGVTVASNLPDGDVSGEAATTPQRQPRAASGRISRSPRPAASG